MLTALPASTLVSIAYSAGASRNPINRSVRVRFGLFLLSVSVHLISPSPLWLGNMVKPNGIMIVKSFLKRFFQAEQFTLWPTMTKPWPNSEDLKFRTFSNIRQGCQGLWKKIGAEGKWMQQRRKAIWKKLVAIYPDHCDIQCCIRFADGIVVFQDPGIR